MSELTQDSLTQIDDLNNRAWPKRDANPKETRSLADEAKKLAKASGYKLGLGRSLTVSSFLYYRTGQLAKGLDEALSALEILEGAKDLPWLPRLYNNLGLLFNNLGDRPQAMSWLLKQLELSQRIGDRQQEATAIHDMGYVTSNPEQRRELFYKARDLFYEVGDGWGVVLACTYLAEGYTDEGNFQEALHLIDEAKTIDNHEGEAIEKSYLGQALGRIYSEQGNYEVALKHLFATLEGFEQGMGDINLKPSIHLHIGMIYQKKGYSHKAFFHFQNGLHIAQEIDSCVVSYTAHKTLSNYYKGLGDFAKALEHFETFYSLKDTVFNMESEQKMQAMEVLYRTETTKQEIALQHRKNAELQENIETLKTQNSKVKALSNSDPLTGLYNRRYLSEYLEGLESEQLMSIVILDIDYFKKINDTYTHFVGDEVLRNMGKLLTAFLRSTDFAARFGGEEFIIILNNITLEQSLKVCERLQQRLATHTWSETHPDLKVTVSMGLVSGLAQDHQTMLIDADKKLYEAKNNGRNHLVS